MSWNSDEHARLQARQHLQEHHGRVGVLQAPVRVVDEEDVAGAEPVVDREVHLLGRRAHDLVAQRVDLGTRLRVDRDEPRPQTVVLDRPARELGRVAGADLEVQRGIGARQERVERGGVEARQPSVHPRGLTRGGAVRGRVGRRRDAQQRLPQLEDGAEVLAVPVAALLEHGPDPLVDGRAVTPPRRGRTG